MGNSSHLRIPWVILLLWGTAACLLSGFASAIFEMPSLWGKSDSLLEYILPLPFGWGMLHYPGLIFFGFLLTLVSVNRKRWLRAAQHLCIGVLLAVFLVVVISDTLRGFPLTMYLGVDAATAWVATVFIGGVNNPAQPLSPKLSLSYLLGPSALTLFLIVAAPYALPRYNFAKSDTSELGPNRDVVQFWVYLNHASGDAAKECKHLKRYATSKQHIYPKTDGHRHRKILLFKTVESLRGGNAGRAWVTYEWWPDGRVSCSADYGFK